MPSRFFTAAGLGAASLLILGAAFAGNGQNPPGQPFAALWDAIAGNTDAIDANADAIAALQDQLDALQAQVDGMSTGPDASGAFDVPSISSGTSYCAEVSFGASFGSAPQVFLSPHHTQGVAVHGTAVTHDPVTTWLEWVTADGFRACVAEDDEGPHDDHLAVDWIAFE